ncbi:MAG: hypothetical protein JJE17_03440 [Peptostreptococcaceae bacterium]|nr:hypothetical protein [Peptostreptococcaceae bacterium]
MTFPSDQIEELKNMFPEVFKSEEGGYPFFFIPNFELPTNCTPSVSDVLLCPTPRDGYNSRLYFSDIIQTSKILNWNANGIRILERNWYAFSWTTKDNLRLAQMIATHIRGLG